MKPAAETPAARLAQEFAACVAPEQILLTLRQALVADCVARDGSRQPDHRARLDAAKLLLAYGVGLPIQRQQIETKVTNNDNEVVMRYLQSPALRAALRQELDDAERGATPAVNV